VTQPAPRTYYRLCSTCKDPIPFESRYFLCSVSTCNRKRMTLTFCSLSCWDAHQADARHRDAGAEEARAPTQAEWQKEQDEERRAAAAAGEPAAPELRRVAGAASLDTLVVASRLKDYVRDRAGMSTSDRALGVLSDHLRSLMDDAILAAGKDGRRTVMDRDVTPLTSPGAGSLASGAHETDDRPDEVWIVVSKLKQYVKSRSGMNTSDSVASVLSAHLRRVARQAIRKAAADDRKTLLDRDFVQALGAR
jgi:histone H3/H4